MSDNELLGGSLGFLGGTNLLVGWLLRYTVLELPGHSADPPTRRPPPSTVTGGVRKERRRLVAALTVLLPLLGSSKKRNKIH